MSSREFSKHEAKKTSRQEWAEISSGVQHDINTKLEEFNIEIEATNLLLSSLYAEDPDKARELSTDLIRYLDSEWEYSSDYFMVTGEWYVPYLDTSSGDIRVEHVKEQAFDTVRSNGFMVSFCRAGDEIEPRVGMSFVAADLQAGSPTVQGRFQLLTFAEPEEISLQYVRPGDPSVVSSDLEEASMAIEKADSLLNLYTNHKNTSFYDQSASKQSKFLQSIIDLVNETLPAPDSLDKLMLERVEASTLYLKSKDRPGLVRLNALSDDKPFYMSGEIVGVTVHDQIHFEDGKRFASPDELMASKVGLSLVVKPYQTNFSLEGYDEQDVIVPVRTATKLEMNII